MIFHQIEFGAYQKGKFDEAYDLVDSYLSSLIRDGQIFYDTKIVPWQNKVYAYVDTAGPQAFLRKYHSAAGREKLGEVKNYFNREPTGIVHEDSPPIREVSWKKASSLFLCTNHIEKASPISLGDREATVPIYLLPLSDQLRDEIYRWQCAYRAVDQVWFDSETLETPAYREMTDPQSTLSQNGRRLCTEIEKATGIRTYYYLHRFYCYEDNQKEMCRPCPNCGKNWHVESYEGYHFGPFFQFGFRCESCRLVSHDGLHISNRYAKIGDKFGK